MRTPSKPLDTTTRAFFEPRFGRDFAAVRVHTGSVAAQSAREVDADAYTVGDQLVFGAGRYAPHTSDGRQLIAHELAHVAQQSRFPSIAVMRAPAGKPPVPKPGHTPFNFISESPALSNWKKAAKGVLERAFKSKFGSFEEAQEHFRKYLQSLPNDGDREHFADRMRDRARKAFYRAEGKNPSYAYEPEDTRRLKGGAAPETSLQLEHMEDVKSKQRGGTAIKGRPERALDPANIYVTEGGPGGTAPKGTKHAEKYRKIEEAKQTSRKIGAQSPKPATAKTSPPTKAASLESAPSATKLPARSVTAAGGAGKTNPSLLGKMIRGGGKMMSVALPALAVAGPIFETIDAIQTFNAAKAIIDELKQDIDQMWAIYDAMLADMANIGPLPDPEPPEPERSLQVYEFVGLRLRTRDVGIPESAIGSAYVPVSFWSLTDVDTSVLAIEPSQFSCPTTGTMPLLHGPVRHFEGYAKRKDAAELNGLFGKQRRAIAFLCALDRLARGMPVGGATEPDGEQVTVTVHLLDALEPVTAVASQAGVDPTWTEETIEGDFNALWEETYSEAGLTHPSDYALTIHVRRTVAGQVSDHWMIKTSVLANPDSEVVAPEVMLDGELPPGAADPSRYPAGLVNWMLEHYGTGLY